MELTNPENQLQPSLLPPQKNPRSREDKIKHWELVIADWKTSGLKQNAYCRSKSISYSVFKAWRYRLLTRSRKSTNPSRSSSAFIPVSVRSSPSAIVLNTPSGYSISFSETIDLKKLAGIMTALKLVS